MPIVVDHIKIDEDNPIFYHAAKFVLNGMDDNTDLVFLTGKAGTGKTTFLKYIAERVKNCVILAPTGIAAINAGGQTIHSFFHLNPNILYTPDNPNLSHNAIYGHLALNQTRQRTIQKMELLIIDEVSMLRCEILDAIDRALKAYRHNSNPFGGVPTLLIGDIFQLPPVNDDWDVLKDYYETEFFYSSNAYRNSRTKFFELDKVYRQEDQSFLGVLNHIRTGAFDLADMGILNERVMRAAPEDGAICIYPFNAMADGLNSTKYNEIKEQEYVFEGEIRGEFVVEKMANVEKTIKLKVGVRVMTMVNQYSADGNFIYYNGSIGTITAIDPQLRWVSVRMTDSDRDVTVWRNVWKNVQQIYDEENDEIVEKEIGSFTQIPVRLAWAITIHKSQGLTLNSVQVNVNGTFAPGQTYVALSRCRSLSGLYLEQPVGLGSVFADKRVVSFYNIVHAEFARVFNEVSQVNELYDEALKNFKERNAADLIDNICKARRINNYITRAQHADFIEIVSKHIEEYWHNRELAVKVEETELRCQTLQEDLVILQKTHKETLDDLDDSKSKINTMGIQVEELEQKKISLTNDLEVSKSAIAVIEKLIQDQNTKISQLEGNLKEKDNRIDELKEEIDRVNSLPWWKVLLGKR